MAKVPMRKGQRTRREIIEKAAPLFNQKGLEGTSLADLMSATGLQKGGIYRHFRGKEELAAEAFDHSWQKVVNLRFGRIDRIANSVDRLEQFIADFAEIRTGLVAGGCPLMNAAVDSDDGNDLLRAKTREALSAWTEKLEAIVIEGQRKKEIRAGVEPRDVAHLIIASLEGGLLLTRIERDSEALRSARKHLIEYLEEKVRK
jgi:TetR/AcrR family transcriptional regulator, transcriptional repressor for nem operon